MSLPQTDYVTIALPNPMDRMVAAEIPPLSSIDLDQRSCVRLGDASVTAPRSCVRAQDRGTPGGGLCGRTGQSVGGH